MVCGLPLQEDSVDSETQAESSERWDDPVDVF